MIIVVILTGKPRFFIKAVVDLAIGLAIGGDVSIGINIAVGFSKLFL